MLKIMNYFLNNHDIIRTTTTGYEAGLKRADEVQEKRSKTVDQSFSDDFKHRVTQTNRPDELSQSGTI